jgi:hypothetical protein
MRIWKEIACTLFLGAVTAPAGAAKVYVRWTQSDVPSATILGVSDLVIPWDDTAKGLVEAAKKQRYRVFLEVKLEEGPAAAEAASTAGIAGIILKGEASEANQVGERASKLRRLTRSYRFWFWTRAEDSRSCVGGWYSRRMEFCRCRVRLRSRGWTQTWQ